MKVKLWGYCLACAYYGGSEHRMECRRYPPSLDRKYPRVGRRGIDGCGEWVHNRKTKQKLKELQ